MKNEDQINNLLYSTVLTSLMNPVNHQLLLTVCVASANNLTDSDNNKKQTKEQN